jgi:ABC-type transport system involved in multi-copper enzyme maturation permease subunit
MFHGVLTLLTRALKSDARFRRAHAFRVGSTLLIFLFLLVAHATSGGVGSPGLRFFALISWLNLALITLAGSSFFATAITEEKEEGTLGLLQLAGVSNLGLLLGKSTSRLVAALLVFLAQLPFALLAVSLGGVTPRQVVAVDLALAACMVMLANVALLASVVSRRSSMSSAVMVLFLLFLLPGVHFGHHSVRSLVGARYLNADAAVVVAAEESLELLQQVSVVTRIRDLLQVGGEVPLISSQVVLHLIAAGAAFALSWLAFDRFSRYADVVTAARGILPKLKQRRTVFIERPWKWALVWKDYHFITGGHALALAKLIGYPLLLWALFEHEEELRRVSLMHFAQLSRQVMFVILGCELAMYASRMFQEEAKWGTLPNLMMLPQSLPAISIGKTAGCLLGLLPAFVTICGLHVFLWTEIAAEHVNSSGEERYSRDLMLFLETFVLGDLTEPAVWMILMQFLVLLHLTVLCSILVKWGGLALAIGIQLILNALLAGPMSVVIAGLTGSYQSDEVAIAPIIYVGGLVCVLLQLAIGWRVHLLAGR